MSKKIVIFGTSALTDSILYDAENHDDFDIAAITVNEKYIERGVFLGLPLIAFEVLEKHYSPSDFDMLMAFSGRKNMRVRNELLLKIKNKGYSLRNYISPNADCPSDIKMGENNIIMSFASVGARGKMGDNNLIRQQVYLGHDFIIGSHNIFAPTCRLGGNCIIEDFAYIGIGATVNNGIKIGEESLVGSGAVVIRDIEEFSVNVGNPSRIIRHI